ncbi:NAC domain-containing protein 2 [Ziziphus jujuba]|uniref:NAC domain-containing protein 2 n=2 Tax=Ziziphus jujuba TaxID=326968 RepID=A0A6P3YRQ1_ZIZJJ|nr:NAC domain-containing protein 2 [Ziziphus jujuba]KAH7537290.1 hypothetical protein FEM48_Zijuj03G0077000 [Ziziphus jujuba var. spinosa]
MALEESMVPRGCSFRPTDDELVGYYLMNKATGCPCPDLAMILEYDFLGDKEPWEIWNLFQPCIFRYWDAHHEDLYFFTKLKKSNPRGKRICRKVGSTGGTWKGQDSGSEVYDDLSKQVIGLKKRFQYQKAKTEEDDEEDDGVSWIMFEYCLAGSLAMINIDYVLCQIRKKFPTQHNHKINMYTNISYMQ